MRPRPLLTVAALTVAGLALRLAVAGQGLFADELSTYWIVTGGGLDHVISTVHTDAEITPPLFFALSWMFAQLGHAPELIRAPSLIAGTATIPLTYAVGRRTVGTPAALVAAGLVTVSPFLVYYSAEARGYAVMVALVLGSTLALLLAAERGGIGWWALYAACACGAVYSHYTSVFALAAQLGWLLWAHPHARRPALLASAAAAIGFLPWLSGLRADLDSPTTDILAALQPLTLGYVRAALVHWAVGYPYATPLTEVEKLPGTFALGLLALAVALAFTSLMPRATSGVLRMPGRAAWLPVVIAVSVPVCELLGDVIGGGGLFGVRNLAAAWPAFALCLAGGLLAAGPRTGAIAAAMALAAFAIGGLKMLDGDFARPDAAAEAAFIERESGRGDVVVDGASLSPAGVPTALDAELNGSRRVFHLGRDEVAYDPFRLLALAKPVNQVVREAATAARGRRLVLLYAEGAPLGRAAVAAVPPGLRRVATAHWGGIVPTQAVVYEDQTANGA
jgi:hypothetical protein